MAVAQDSRASVLHLMPMKCCLLVDAIPTRHVHHSRLMASKVGTPRSSLRRTASAWVRPFCRFCVIVRAWSATHPGAYAVTEIASSPEQTELDADWHTFT